jgi:predicted dehydrogenase
LLSTANINKRLIPAIRASARGELVAVASRRQDAADAYAAAWGIPRAFGSYTAMLASGEVDAVYVSLPNHLHAEWTVRALEHGVHVLCEKPFALTLEDVDRMADAARDNGRVLAEAFMYRHHPQTKAAGAFVREGRLGALSLFRGTFSFSLSDRNNVRLIPEWGGGSLWDIGVYPLSFAQFVMSGPPEWVFGQQRLGGSGVDVAFSGELHYGDGVMAQISCAFDVPWYTHVDVLGERGRLVLNRPFTGLVAGERRLTFVDEDNNAQELPVEEQELYAGEVEDMHDAILDGRPPYLGLDETRNHVKTVLALYESARRGERVYLEEISS